MIRQLPLLRYAMPLIDCRDAIIIFAIA